MRLLITAAPNHHAALTGAVLFTKPGVVTVRDQYDALQQMLERWDFIDESRVGIWGHSGGGSQTLNALFRYPDSYHMGMALAPVPDLTLYDTIYQERYSGLLPESAERYKETSAITHAENLEGDLLLVHGTGDDNVHFQGSERTVNELIKHGKQFEFLPTRTALMVFTKVKVQPFIYAP